MNILRYDDSKYDMCEIQTMFTKIKECLPDNEDLIALPKDFDLLLDCSSADLYYFRGHIDEAIKTKEIMG